MFALHGHVLTGVISIQLSI